MKTITKSILFVLTVVLLFAPMVQKRFNVPRFRSLKGVVEEQEMPEWSFERYRDGSFQQQTEAHLKLQFGWREPLIRLYNQYVWDFYGKTFVNEGQVVFGKDGWMYEPWVVADYYQQLSRNYAPDSAQMAALLSAEAQRVLQLQEILDSLGTKLFVCLVPAKDLICPEHLPENQENLGGDDQRISARFFNEEEYTRLGINHLNLEQWFLQIKDTADFMLFPKTGTHWSRYAALQASDTLIRYMEHLGNINMHNLVIGPRYLHSAINPDDDLESLLNLARPLPKPKYWYADADADADTAATKPKLIVIGDSFWWTIAYQLPLDKLFSQVPYWYYNSTVYYDQRYNSVQEFDILDELLSADFIALFYCATQQYRMNDGFTQKALEAFADRAGGAVFDTAAFIEREIQVTIANIINTPEWMALIREKAKERDISTEQALHDDAEWLVYQKIEQGLLEWPNKKKESYTTPE